jgi:hypothetical protein
MLRRISLALLAILLCSPSSVQAQRIPTGYVSLFGDYIPNRSDTVELRSRLFAEQTFEPSEAVRLTLSGFAEALVARRPVPTVDGTVRSGSVTDGILKAHDANVEILGRKADVLAGYARVVWGKLDEIQPTDVINPLDVSRFFFEGRSEARLPVLMIRGRLHPNEHISVEGIYVPDFRRGRFDQLDEDTSPFNITTAAGVDAVTCLALGCPAVLPPIVDRQPALTWRNAQGGARVSATTGRADWSVSAYRGFEPFGLFQLSTAAPPPGTTIPSAVVLQQYPRLTMLGADFEAVRGAYGFRGEIAAFVDDSFQSPDLRIVSGSSIDGGVGFDRKAGDYTISGTVLFHSESYDSPVSSRDPSDGRNDVSFVFSTDRTFARERYRLRGFGVYNATESSGFLRAIGIASLHDNLALEASIGWFAGDGRDLVGRFGDSDFAYLRVKYHF